MSVWEVVNGMTNFASNDNKYNIDDHKTGNLMVTAGNLLMKKSYDTEALLQFDPNQSNIMIQIKYAHNFNQSGLILGYMRIKLFYVKNLAGQKTTF